MIDLKWDQVSLGITLDAYGEAVQVEGNATLEQSLLLALRDNPLTRLFLGAEPLEAHQIADQLCRDLEQQNPEVVPGSLSYRLEGGKLDLALQAKDLQGVDLHLYFKDLFHAS